MYAVKADRQTLLTQFLGGPSLYLLSDAKDIFLSDLCGPVAALGSLGLQPVVGLQLDSWSTQPIPSGSHWAP